MQSLGQFLDAYLDAARRFNYREVTTRQQSPHASIAHGAAGLVYGLWRVAKTGHSSDALDTAAHFAHWIARTRSTRAYYFAPPIDGQASETSIYWGRIGGTFVDTILSNTLGHFGRSRRTLARYLRLSESVEDTCELLEGATGRLNATIIIARECGSDAAFEHARALATRVGTGLRRLSSNGSFAHGWAGAYHGLLRWHEFCDKRIPDWIEADLVRRTGEPLRFGPGSDQNLRYSWCNGASGRILLWVKAYELTENPIFLAAARELARSYSRDIQTVPNLCCGLGGIAYACLALARVESKARWRAIAAQFATRAAAGAPGAYATGLLYGFPGLVCLAADVTAQHPLGFPCVED